MARPPLCQIIRNALYCRSVTSAYDSRAYRHHSGWDLTTLSIEDFISLMTFAKRTARALLERLHGCSAHRSGQGDQSHSPPWCRKKLGGSCSYRVSYYLNSKSGAKLSASDLEAMRRKIITLSGLRDTDISWRPK